MTHTPLLVFWLSFGEDFSLGIPGKALVKEKRGRFPFPIFGILINQVQDVSSGFQIVAWL